MPGGTQRPEEIAQLPWPERIEHLREKADARRSLPAFPGVSPLGSHAPPPPTGTPGAPSPNPLPDGAASPRSRDGGRAGRKRPPAHLRRNPATAAPVAILPRAWRDRPRRPATAAAPAAPPKPGHSPSPTPRPFQHSHAGLAPPDSVDTCRPPIHNITKRVSRTALPTESFFREGPVYDERRR